MKLIILFVLTIYLLQNNVIAQEILECSNKPSCQKHSGIKEYIDTQLWNKQNQLDTQQNQIRELLKKLDIQERDISEQKELLVQYEERLKLLEAGITEKTKEENTTAKPMCTEATATQATTEKPICVEHEGTEFIITFYTTVWSPGNPGIELYMTSYEGSSRVQIDSQYPGISTNVTLSDKSIRITIPTDSSSFCENSINTNGLRIKSSSPISVRGARAHGYFYLFSGFTALPIEMLGTNYMVLPHSRQMGIVVLEDGTTITVTINTTADGALQYDGHSYHNGDVITLLMNKLQTVNCLQSRADLTGTLIHSDKPIAVISGFDHIMKMVPPVDKWGHTHIIPLIESVNEIIVRIMLSENNTNLHINDTITTYGTAQTIEINIPSAITYVHCSKPCLVVLYDIDRLINTFTIIIPSTEQYSNHYVLETPTEDTDNYISLMIESMYLDGLFFNEERVSGQVMTFVDKDQKQWSSIVLTLQNGTSVISHSSENVYFGLIQYGFHQHFWYAYGFHVGLGYKTSC